MRKERSRPGSNRTAKKHAQWTAHHLDYSTGSPSTPIYVGNRVIGEVAGDVFRKAIRGSLHMLRRPPAIAFDVSTLHDAERAGARFVEVTDAETGRLYAAPLALIWARGFRVNRGHGEQLALILSDFNRPAEKRPEQLSLFAF